MSAFHAGSCGRNRIARNYKQESGLRLCEMREKVAMTELSFQRDRS